MITEQTIQAMNAAVNMLHAVKHTKASDLPHIMDVTNNILRTQGVSIDGIEEAETILDRLVGHKYVRNRSGVITPIVRTEVKMPSFNGKTGQRMILDILDPGEVLTMYFSPLFKKADKKYVIKYNIDGKGGILLPDNTVVSDQLGSLAKRVMIEHSDDLPYIVVTQNAWKVDPEFHEDAKGNFKNYLMQRYKQQRNIVA